MSTPKKDTTGKTITTSESGYRALIAQILNVTLADAGKTTNGEENDLARRAKVFAESSWCRELCEGLEISYDRYLKAFNRLRNKRLRKARSARRLNKRK